MSNIHLSSRRDLSTELRNAILDVLLAAANEDGAYPLSEDVVLSIQHGSEATHVVAYVDDAVAGYAFVGNSIRPKVELAVSPTFRRHGVGRALLDFVCESNDEIELWAHGNNASAKSLALNAGFEESRTLIHMRRSLLNAIDEADFPNDITVRSFNADLDFDAWLTCNAEAFGDHPDQGTWSEQELRLRLNETWFNPEGFLVAYQGDTMVGFHWTKVHSEEVHAERLGEVYIVGVVPSCRGIGLGRALALAGLAHLRSQGLTSAMLYVDASDHTAMSLYESLGFAHWDNDTLFVKRK
ncbi:MAG: mycothiol acetyltransferase [Actinomycetota bacterium]|jgi:mycothiol synthase